MTSAAFQLRAASPSKGRLVSSTAVHQALRRGALGMMIGLGALALAGCQSRGGAGDVTGSIARSPKMAAPTDWQAERDTWDKRYAANPKDRDAAFYYARALRALNQHVQAVAVLQGAVLVHQDDRELLGAYGRALADAGRLREADEVLARAHTPERPDWRILSAQGTVADQLGEHDRAQQIYQTALRLVPGEPTVMSNLGLSLALSRHLPEAERVLREAAAAPGADARVRQNLVLVLGLQGRFADAEQIARQDQSPAEAAATIAYLKRSVSQTNSWDLLKNGRPKTPPPGQPSAAQERSGRAAEQG